jgi:hypothetical protein
MTDSRPCGSGTRRAAILGGGFALLAAGLLSSVGPTAFGTASAAGVCKPAPAYLATAAGETIGGIGGTGRSDPGGDGGIGGTGIVGTITGFASVCVNGVEVHYDDKVPVSENGRTSSVGALAVGQVVALDAGPGKLGLTARRIEVVHALEGPVTKSEGGRLEVMGAPVVPADATLRGGIETLKAGQWVQVNGHRDESGRWVATRVAKIESRGEATVLAGAEAGDRIGGVRVTGLPSTGSGEARLVRGEWKTEPGDTSGRLRVRESVVAPAGAMLARAERVIVETRVREVKEGRVRTGHPEIDATLSGRDVREGDLVRVRAVREADGRIRAERVERSARQDAAERSDSKRRDDATKGVRGGDRDKADRDGDRIDGVRSESMDRAAPEKGERIDRMEKPEKIEKNEKIEKPEKPEKTEKPEKPDKVEKIERTEKTDRGERSDRVDRSEPRADRRVRD